MITCIEYLAEQIMTDDAIKSYPNECIGFFFGTDDPDGKKILGAMMVNSKEGNDIRRIPAISPRDYQKAELYAKDRGWSLLGVYHSCPDMPAIPSEHDRSVAIPSLSYIIISVKMGRQDDIRSWVLHDSREFEEELLIPYQHKMTG